MARSRYAAAHARGYRSGLEVDNSDKLTAEGVPFEYEKHKIGWVDFKIRSYTPDFLLGNGIIVETKGRFTPEDRQKHIRIKEQYPDLDIRFVFTRSATKLSKVSNTTYASWCKKHGFLYADKTIPQAWIDEGPVGYAVAERMAETKRIAKRAKLAK